MNAAIGFKPLYALMKVGAKHVLQSTAERNGVPWRATVRQLENTPEVGRPLAQLSAPARPVAGTTRACVMSGSFKRDPACIA